MSTDVTIVDRDEITFPDGEGGRLYLTEGGVILASVTTILNRRDDPDKDAALKYWRQNNDGVGDNPDHNHLLWYSQQKGTLCHYYVLSHLTDMEPTEEEFSSWREIEKHDTNYNRIHSVLQRRENKGGGSNPLPDKDDYYTQLGDDDVPTLTDIMLEDMAWCLREFAELTPKLGLADIPFSESEYFLLGDYYDNEIHREKVIDAETYVYNIDDQYAGQFDLLTERDGKTILTDLKTSAAIRWSHKAQGAAYERALDREVDTLEVVQLHPDTSDSHVSRHDDWADSRSELYDEFAGVNTEHVQPLMENIDVNDHFDI